MREEPTAMSEGMGRGFDATRLNDQAIFSHRRLSRVRHALCSDPSQPISLASAARLAGLEPHYFSGLFHTVSGVCFKQWVTHVRIKTAQELIRTSKESITAIAFSVGYNDLRSFERAFRRHSGITPAQFRRVPGGDARGLIVGQAVPHES